MKRAGSVPTPDWWLKLASEKAKDLKLTQRQIADLAGFSGPSGQTRVSRAMSGETTTLETIEAISAALQIPRPFAVFENADEAILVEGHLAIRRNARKLTS